MNQEQERHLAEGIKIIIEKLRDYDNQEGADEWLDKYKEVFPVIKRFGE